MECWFFNLFPLVSRKRALKIATKACLRVPEYIECSFRKPNYARTYNGPPESEPCWWISIWYCDRVGSGRIIAVSKRTGKILYDGDDGGE
jgi:hypothetical protein